ncbi:MAG: hypothetical protein LLG06_11665 [Desulfobacteraceae bacterium]|nr:hypothetical protein [Desulfobacteraceae bacterium]
MKPTRDCNTCGFSKSLSSKTKGRRVSGGFGKCTYEGGCTPEKARLGIGGAESKWRAKGDERGR